MEADVQKVNAAIKKLIRSDNRLKQLFSLVTSVTGVGKVTAIQIIIATNEFISIDCPKKFACYAGVAPFKKDSGLVSGKARVSRIGNRSMKSLLHICAIDIQIFNNKPRAILQLNSYPQLTLYQGSNRWPLISRYPPQLNSMPLTNNSLIMMISSSLTATAFDINRVSLLIGRPPKFMEVISGNLFAMI